MAKLSNRLLLLLSLLLIALVLFAAWLLFSPESYQVIESQSESKGIFGRGLYNTDPSHEAGQKADPNYIIQLPSDHYEHTRFDIEWWYLTANVNDQEGNAYGLQWTLFRFKNPLAPSPDDLPDVTWNNKQIYMAHASVHSMENHWFSEKFARGGVGNAGVTAEPFSLFIDHWQWQNKQSGQGLLPAQLSFDAPINQLNNASSTAAAPVLSVNLTLEQSGPYVFHGKNGYSLKSSTSQHASHYYSAPFIVVGGTFTFDNPTGDTEQQTLEVTGKAWFDQEWTSQLLDTQTAGWDWMSLHLDDGSKLMAFSMRLKGQDNYVTGSLISPDGQLRTLLPTDISLTPIQKVTVNTRKLPLSWRVEIPSESIDITVQALKDDQWNPAFVSYYEGMVGVKGSHTGRGFLELTGY